MTLALNKRRLLLVTGALVLLMVFSLLLARLALTGMAVGSLLRLAGASEIKFDVASASPWRVVVENIGFQVKTQVFSARRVSFVRLHWWTPSLGTVRVEQARVPVTIDGSDTNPQDWPTYKNGTATVAPTSLPLEELSIDGQLVIHAATLPDQALTVKFEAHPVASGQWSGQVEAGGPGLGLKGQGSFDQGKNELAFRLPELSLDLKVWQGFVQRLVVLPGGTWDMEGKLTGSAEGRLVGKSLVASGKVRLREGRVRYAPKDITAEGIEADLEFTDLDKFVTKPGTVSVRELRTGQLSLTDIKGEFAFADANKIVITHASLKALGGSISAEPFTYYLDQRELDAVLLADGINVEEVMALTQNLPAKATGRVDGRLPVRIDASGLRLGTGWLALKPGIYAELQLNAGGLLTAGVAPGSPSYAVMKKIESGLLKLKIGEMRLDIRPPNAPPGRSAQLHITGEPVDPEVKAPVILDLNVNGPIEKLINLSMDSRVSFGGSKP
jgi:hypothetical protein